MGESCTCQRLCGRRRNKPTQGLCERQTIYFVAHEIVFENIGYRLAPDAVSSAAAIFVATPATRGSCLQAGTVWPV